MKIFVRKTTNVVFLIVLINLFGASCNSILDVKNISAITPEETWSDPNLANAYLAGLYSSVMPSGWPSKSGALFAGLALDESRNVINQTTIQITSHTWAGSFEASYRNIRNINILLEEIEKGSISKENKDKIIGQAKFLRAFSYFLLLRVYGGVPLLLKAQNINDDLNVRRASTKEIFDAIETDLDSSISLLQGQKFVDDDYGRIGEAAALAFKGRVSLYKASPLFNPKNPYGNTYWQQALAATKTAKDRLEAMGFVLNSTYNGIWSAGNKGNKEEILTVIFVSPTKPDGRNEYCVRPPSQSICSGAENPLWSLVEAYPMKDGYTIKTSPNYTYDEQTFWKNRDPRFDQTIVYNGAIYEAQGIAGRRQYTTAELTAVGDTYSIDANANSRTGLYNKKALQLELSQASAGQNSVDWTEIRYAEVLLNYAEAANETGNQATAIDILKQIRKRAGIEAGTGNYGVVATTKEDVREAILLERFVEFVFEGQRFWDLKRHRKFSQLNGTVQKGVQATLKTSNLPVDSNKKDKFLYLPEDFDYTIGPILKGSDSERTFDIPERYYFAPIPLRQIQKNPSLEQSKDWGGRFEPTIE